MLSQQQQQQHRHPATAPSRSGPVKRTLPTVTVLTNATRLPADPTMPPCFLAELPKLLATVQYRIHS